MRPSHRLFSRLLLSPVKGYSRATNVGGSLHSLLQLNEKNDGFEETHRRSFSALIRSCPQLRGFLSSRGLGVRCSVSLDPYTSLRNLFTRAKQVKRIEINDQHSQRAVTTALWCNFLVFSLKFGVWWTSSSHVIMAEVVHSVADFANQALLAYGLSSSRRAPDALHPYGYSKERFVWSLISAVGIFCLGSGATIVNGVQNLWTSEPPPNMEYAAVLFLNLAMLQAYILRVVDALYDCKSEVIGPGSFRFKAEIDFNGQVVVQNYLKRTRRDEWSKLFREAAEKGDDSAMLNIMSNYGEEVVTALGSEVIRLEKQIRELVPGIQHVDIEAHNPKDQSL
ncbi:unnamed protein product [Eruca vesicaria subsp. sativa]|uniref:Cation efflux protein transmembrane domain-containing protein n=1 Tax=Eruca vesicaria subsp. sativa TaxID=29727 RepID=A0ABC8IVQ8_ERUVS|nr:unnamed protein product [Eruca vesicaria subsp. sativa]